MEDKIKFKDEANHQEEIHYLLEDQYLINLTELIYKFPLVLNLSFYGF